VRRAAGLPDQKTCESQFHNPACRHRDHKDPKVFDRCRFLRDEEIGNPRLGWQLAPQVQDPRLRAYVEPAVGSSQTIGRGSTAGARDSDALPLAAGERMGQALR